MSTRMQADPLHDAETVAAAVDRELERRARLAAEMHHDGSPREPEPEASLDMMGGGLDVPEKYDARDFEDACRGSLDRIKEAEHHLRFAVTYTLQQNARHVAALERIAFGNLTLEDARSVAANALAEG